MSPPPTPWNLALKNLLIIQKFVSGGSILANAVSLMAICWAPGHLTGSLDTINLRLIGSLTVADIVAATSALVAPAAAMKPQRNMTEEEACVTMTAQRMRITAHFTALCSLLGLAFDQYLAICRPFYHRLQAASKRVNVTIASFWAVSLACAFSDVIAGSIVTVECADHSADQRNYTFCKYTNSCASYYSVYLVYPATVIVFISMLILYSLSCRRIVECRHLRNNDGQRCQPQTTRRNRRALCTTTIIIGGFFACWMPYSAMESFMAICSAWITFQWPCSLFMDNITEFTVLSVFFYNLLILGCFVDPFVYAIRMREVQRGYQRLGRQCRHHWLKLLAALPFVNEQSRLAAMTCARGTSSTSSSIGGGTVRTSGRRQFQHHHTSHRRVSRYALDGRDQICAGTPTSNSAASSACQQSETTGVSLESSSTLAVGSLTELAVAGTTRALSPVGSVCRRKLTVIVLEMKQYDIASADDIDNHGRLPGSSVAGNTQMSE